MENSLNIFGSFYRKERKRLDLSLWKVAIASGTHIRNIQRIEAGSQQPGVAVAMRLVDALGIAPGDFFSRLVEENTDNLPISISPLERIDISYQMPAGVQNQKSSFGLLLAQARTAAFVSQTAMAKAAGYSLRNIKPVESGKQEPGITTAIALVRTTGVDIAQFFDKLHEITR